MRKIFLVLGILCFTLIQVSGTTLASEASVVGHDSSLPEGTGDSPPRVSRFHRNFNPALDAIARYERPYPLSPILQNTKFATDSRSAYGGEWLGWNGSPGLDDQVFAVAVKGKYVYTGGEELYSGTYHGYVDMWDGVHWTRIGVFNKAILAMAVNGGDLYVGGYFMNGIAKWNGHEWSGLQSGVHRGWVMALAIRGSALYVGGEFNLVGGAQINNLARWDMEAHTWSDVGGGLNSTVDALAVVGSDLYVGGSFIQVVRQTKPGDSPTARGIAKWDGTWSALGSGLAPRYVWALAANKSKVYAGGWFDTAGGISVNSIAEWDIASRSWSALGKSVSGLEQKVEGLALKGTALYVAGEYDHAGNIPANNIARWDTKRRRWSALGDGVGKVSCEGNSDIFDNYAVAVAVQGKDVYVGGCFLSPTSNIAHWHNSGKSPGAN